MSLSSGNISFSNTWKCWNTEYSKKMFQFQEKTILKQKRIEIYLNAGKWMSSYCEKFISHSWLYALVFNLLLSKSVYGSKFYCFSFLFALSKEEFIIFSHVV